MTLFDSLATGRTRMPGRTCAHSFSSMTLPVVTGIDGRLVGAEGTGGGCVGERNSGHEPICLRRVEEDQARNEIRRFWGAHADLWKLRFGRPAKGSGY